MSNALKKMNFMIEEAVFKELETLVPAGKRSRVANDALRKELELIRRRDAVERMLAGRTTGRKLSNEEIADALARDRSSH